MWWGDVCDVSRKLTQTHIKQFNTHLRYILCRTCIKYTTDAIFRYLNHSLPHPGCQPCFWSPGPDPRSCPVARHQSDPWPEPGRPSTRPPLLVPWRMDHQPAEPYRQNSMVKQTCNTNKALKQAFQREEWMFMDCVHARCCDPNERKLN